MKIKLMTVLCLLIAVASYGLDVGTKAPDFTLTSTTGKPFHLADMKGKDMVLIFVATRCPFSNAHNQVMSHLASDYTTKGIPVYGINSNESEPLQEVAQHTR